METHERGDGGPADRRSAGDPGGYGRPPRVDAHGRWTPTVAEVVEQFAPTAVAPARFRRVEGLVRAAVEASRPESPQRAADMVRCASYLAGWCDHLGFELDRRVVFDAQVVEEFVASLHGRVAQRSAATIASVLRAMSRGLVGSPVPAWHQVHRRRRSRPPYRDEEVVALFGLAAGAKSAKRRHDLAGLLVLGLGAGASGQEAALVRPSDVTDDGGVVLRRRRRDNTWRQRTVTVLPAHRDLLVELVDGCRSEWLLGGGRTRHSRVYDLCDLSRAGRWPVRLEPARLRSTYLAVIAAEPTTLVDLLDRAGVTTLEVFDELLPYLRNRGG